MDYEHRCKSLEAQLKHTQEGVEQLSKIVDGTLIAVALQFGWSGNRDITEPDGSVKNYKYHKLELNSTDLLSLNDKYEVLTNKNENGYVIQAIKKNN